MAGHNKLSKIKRKKEAKDIKKGANLAKLSKKIILAVKSGGEDLKSNSKLRTAVDEAKAAGMAKATIDNAIKKASGSEGKSDLKEVLYEGYLPGGVALMIFTATDNLKRTVQDIKCILSRSEANLGNSGCVSYLFNKIAYTFIEKPGNWDQELEEELLALILETGADDFTVEDEEIIISSSPEGLDDLNNALTDNPKFTILEAKIEMEASNNIEITEDSTIELIHKAISQLESHDDILEVFTNHTEV